MKQFSVTEDIARNKITVLKELLVYLGIQTTNKYNSMADGRKCYRRKQVRGMDEWMPGLGRHCDFLKSDEEIPP